MIKINEPIEEFEAEAFHEGEIRKIKLSDYAGKWLVMLFYPADFTFVCPTELEEAANFHEEFKKVGAEIISISKDTVYVHKAWHEQSPKVGKVKYPMLADPTGKLCKQFGTYIEAEGLSHRATFIIDPDGKLQAYEIHSNDIGRSIAEILRKVQAGSYVREHRGEVCPVAWKPGDKTLKPGMDLVGKL